MEGNSRWQGWAALALAGLALFIALGGRQSQPAYVVQAPGPGYTDGAATAQSAAQDAQRAAADARRAADEAQRGDERGGPGAYDQRGPDFGRGGPGFHDQRGPWAYGRPHAFGPLGFFFGIFKFIGFLLLGLLLLKFIGRRFGWRRGWGGPPWAHGHHGHHGEGDRPAPPAPEQRGDQPPTTGETTKL